jgi:hypothetical protein
MEPFSTEALLNAARQQTGLTDFGPPDFMEGFTTFIASINAQGEISDRHRQEFRKRMLRHLMNRLWFAADLAAHPEILDEDVGSPVIILSLPRTASTKLHRMLGATGDFHTLLMWQAHMFARIPGLPDAGTARRIKETREYEAWMYEVSPESVRGHAMFAEEVEEDYTLLAEATFRDCYCPGIFNVPEYEKWVARADPGPRNSYYGKQMQYLQWQRQPARRLPWLLKSPLLIGGEPEMTKLFKKPRFIFTHRDPVKCIPSIANPVQYMRKMYSDHNNAAALGRSLSRQFSYTTLAHMQWRDSHPEFEVLDLGMREITQDGIATAQKVYDFLNIPLSSTAKLEMRQWEERNPVEKHGRNIYSAEGVGTTDAEIRQDFAPYIERFSNLF